MPLNLVPMPRRVVSGEGRYDIVESTDVGHGPGPLAEVVAEALATRLRGPTGFALPVKPGAGAIEVREAPTAPEGYRLKVDRHGILLEASDSAGFRYGIETLFQHLPEQASSPYRAPRMDPLAPGRPIHPGWEPPGWWVPSVEIEDAPRFPWRGFMLDCSRHFQDVDTVKSCADLLVKLKMNRLHLHLSDNHGWRVEIPGWPKLTELGSRIEPEPARHGFYTAEDIREIVSYAEARSIQVIPEIDVPGHIFSAVKSYPELCCTGEPLRNDLTHWHQLDILCAGSERTFEFLEDVFGALMDLFPAPWIHLGGDEAPKARWRECPRCQSRIRDEGLKGEHDLQGYLVRRVADFLRSRGRRVIGWEEILQADLPQDTIVQWWRSDTGKAGILEGLRRGHEVIASCSDVSYFSAWRDQLADFYSAEYLPREFLAEREDDGDTRTPEAWTRVLGGECCMWTENTPPRLLMSRLLPDILACAEMMWTYPTSRDVADLRRRALALETRIEGTPVLNWGS